MQIHEQPDDYDMALDYLNIIFTAVFGIEFILKLFAFRVKVSFTSGRVGRLFEIFQLSGSIFSCPHTYTYILDLATKTELSHAVAIAYGSEVRAICLSYWKLSIFYPCNSKKLKPINTKMQTIDSVIDIARCAKIHYDGSHGGAPMHT